MVEKESREAICWSGQEKRKKTGERFFGICKDLPTYEINSLILRGLEKSH